MSDNAPLIQIAQNLFNPAFILQFIVRVILKIKNALLWKIVTSLTLGGELVYKYLSS